MLTRAAGRHREQCRVAADDRQPLFERLGDEQPVERVAMVQRELSYALGVMGADGEQLGPVVLERLPEARWRGELAELALDRHFPDADRADDPAVDRTDRLPGTIRQASVSREPPQSRVRVEQQPQSMIPSAAAMSGGSSSKSSPMRT